MPSRPGPRPHRASASLSVTLPVSLRPPRTLALPRPGPGRGAAVAGRAARFAAIGTTLTDERLPTSSGPAVPRRVAAEAGAVSEDRK